MLAPQRAASLRMIIAMVGSTALVMPLSRAASRHAPRFSRIAACAASTDLPPLPSGFIVVDKPPGIMVHRNEYSKRGETALMQLVRDQLGRYVTGDRA